MRKLYKVAMPYGRSVQHVVTEHQHPAPRCDRKRLLISSPEQPLARRTRRDKRPAASRVDTGEPKPIMASSPSTSRAKGQLQKNKKRKVGFPEQGNA